MEKKKTNFMALVFIALVAVCVLGISNMSEKNQTKLDTLRFKADSYDSLVIQNKALKKALADISNLRIRMVFRQQKGQEWFFYARIGDGPVSGDIFASNLDFEPDSLYWVLRMTEPRFQDFVASRFFPESRMRADQVSYRLNDINFGAQQYNILTLQEFGFSKEQAQTWYWLPFINNAYYHRYFEAMSDSTYWTAKYTGVKWAWR
jgi:hypothetical protein